MLILPPQIYYLKADSCGFDVNAQRQTHTHTHTQADMFTVQPCERVQNVPASICLHVGVYVH